MHTSHLQYPPTHVALFVLLGVFVFALLVMLEIGLLNRAYLRLGLAPRIAMLVLIASLVGSYLNIPVAQLPGERVVANAYVDFFGLTYPVPEIVDWPGTIVAINVGGALIPALLSIYLVATYRLLVPATIATAIVAIVVHQLATPIPGVGIAVPLFWPPVLAAIVAIVLSRRYGAPIAYVAGSIGVLIGADLTNLDKLKTLGAPVASIGGAGTFDGVFLAGVVAVLLSGIGQRRAPKSHDAIAYVLVQQAFVFLDAIGNGAQIKTDRLHDLPRLPGKIVLGQLRA